MTDFQPDKPALAGTPTRRGFSLPHPGRLLRRGIVLAFAVIQFFLVARILMDLGIIPAEGWWAGPIITWSDAAAAPVQGIGSGMFGAFGTDMIAGEGFNPVMMVALFGWSIIEPLVMRVANKFASV